MVEPNVLILSNNDYTKYFEMDQVENERIIGF